MIRPLQPTRRAVLRLESEGLRGASVIGVQLVLLVLGAAAAWRPGLRVDVPVLGVLFCALEFRLVPGFLVSLVIGYLADVFSGQPHGLWMAGSLGSYAVLRLLVVRVVGAQLRTIILLAAVAAASSALIRGVLEDQPSRAILARVGAGLAAAVLAYPAYRLFLWASDPFREKDPQTLL